MLSKVSVGWAAAGAGICFIGYCIYFDHKRRSHPDFKKNLREKRRRAKAAHSRSPTNTQIPDLKDTEAMQKFFLQEVQLGEELLGTGDIELGVEHLSNAVAVCGQPQQLLKVLEQTLPPQVFHLLLQRLPAVSQMFIELGFGDMKGVERISSAAASPSLAMDDLE